jgi:hypothetical protein
VTIFNSITFVTILLLLVGCANTGGYCQIDKNQTKLAIQNLSEVRADIEDEDTSYNECWPLTSNGSLMKSEGECWCKLRSESRDPTRGILDGELAVSFELPLMTISSVTDIVY